FLWVVKVQGKLDEAFPEARGQRVRVCRRGEARKGGQRQSPCLTAAGQEELPLGQCAIEQGDVGSLKLVHFVEEEHLLVLGVQKERRHSPFVECRRQRLAEGHAHLGCHDLHERGLTHAAGTGQEEVVHRPVVGLGGCDGNLQPFNGGTLTDHLCQTRKLYRVDCRRSGGLGGH